MKEPDTTIDETKNISNSENSTDNTNITNNESNDTPNTSQPQTPPTPVEPTPRATPTPPSSINYLDPYSYGLVATVTTVAPFSSNANGVIYAERVIVNESAKENSNPGEYCSQIQGYSVSGNSKSGVYVNFY